MMVGEGRGKKGDARGQALVKERGKIGMGAGREREREREKERDSPRKEPIQQIRSQIKL